MGTKHLTPQRIMKATQGMILWAGGGGGGTGHMGVTNDRAIKTIIKVGAPSLCLV